MAEAEAALFSCHLERNDVQSEGLNAENDFRTRNKERRFLIVRMKSVKIRLVRGKSVCPICNLGMTNLQLRIGANERNTHKMAEAVAGLFSCHLERNDVQSKGLLAEIDFRTRNAEC